MASNKEEYTLIFIHADTLNDYGGVLFSLGFLANFLLL
jgi:hypothetical protein